MTIDPNDEYALKFAVERISFFVKYSNLSLDPVDGNCLRLLLAELRRLRPEIFEFTDV